MVERLLAPIKRRVMLMVGKAVVNALKTDGETNIMQLNLMSDTTHDDVEFWQNFGFTSAPPKGSRALVVCVGGNMDHAVVIATENGEFRIKGLKDGEACLYDAHGSKVHLKDDKTIDIKTEAIKIDAPETESTGKIKAQEIEDMKGTLEQLRQFVNTHTHTSAPPGSPTTPPVPPNPIQ